MSTTTAEAAARGHSIELTERITSVFSVVGAAFIISTFALDSRFRKPINRLVFYAAWGNLFANVATLISRSGILAGVTSPLCQFQAFLIHWFMPADALWTFAMACNVYLAFFRHYDTAALRAFEWKYLAACYGIPFVPAFVYLFIETEARGRMYGNANLWCWISSSWNVFRLATFYGPVWLVILATMFIYFRVGLVVFRWRKQLVSADYQRSMERNRLSAMPYTGPGRDLASPLPSKSYEVTITSQVPHSQPSHKKNLSLSSPRDTIHEGAGVNGPKHTRYGSIKDIPYPPPPRTPTEHNINVVVERPQLKTVNAKKAAMSYFKTAMLFFVALFCTWVPSTINRIYGVVYPGHSIFGLDMTAATVLPLQGFWNTIIYIVTSWAACKAVTNETIARLTGRRPTNPTRRLRPISLTLSKHNRRRTLGSDDDRVDMVLDIDAKTRKASHGEIEEC